MIVYFAVFHGSALGQYQPHHKDATTSQLQVSYPQATRAAFDNYVASCSISQTASLEATTYNELGKAHLEKGELKAAYLFFSEAIKIDSLWASPYANIGIAFSRQRPAENIEKVKLAFDKAIKANDRDPYVFMNYGNALLAAKLVDSALYQLEKAFKLCDTSKLIRYNLISARIINETTNDSDVSFLRSLIEDSQRPELRDKAALSLGQYYYSTNRYDLAIKYLEQANLNGTEINNGYRLLRIALERAYGKRYARRYFQRLISENGYLPGPYVHRIAARGRLNFRLRRRTLNRFASNISNETKAGTIEQHHRVAILRNFVRRLYREGDRSSILIALKRFAKQEPDALFFLAEYFAVTGNAREAESALRRLFALPLEDYKLQCYCWRYVYSSDFQNVRSQIDVSANCGISEQRNRPPYHDDLDVHIRSVPPFDDRETNTGTFTSTRTTKPTTVDNPTLLLEEIYAQYTTQQDSTKAKLYDRFVENLQKNYNPCIE